MNPAIMNTHPFYCHKYQRGLEIEMQSMMNWLYMMKHI